MAARESTERCLRLMERIGRLGGGNIIFQSCCRTLLKLARSELEFLSRSSSHDNHSIGNSLNVGHLEAVVHLLELDFVGAVSRVCKPIPVLATSSSTSSFCSSSKTKTKTNVFAHVDIVCTLKQKQIPVWIIVSHRNPNYVSWQTSSNTNPKGLKLRIEQLVAAASCSSCIIKPSSIILFFSRGLTHFLCQNLQHHFGASELTLDFHSRFDFCEELADGDWINVLSMPRTYPDARVFQIKVHSCAIRSIPHTTSPNHKTVNLDDSEDDDDNTNTNNNNDDAFATIISSLTKTKAVDFAAAADDDDNHLLNFDTTALIALVSGISNGCTSKLLATPEVELRERFKGNFDFVIAQVKSEIENPILAELAGLISNRRGIICESVVSEFKELVSLCGGPNEKFRADKILKRLMVVPDCPSERMMSLPTTRKLALKNKVVFGTGDRWRAPTLTANMAFVRAVSQTGMSFLTFEHRPRALTGD